MQFRISSNSSDVPSVVEADEVSVLNGAIMFTTADRLVLLVAAQAWIMVTEYG